MQNKGFVRVFAVLLTLVCLFYLSFSFVTRHYTNKAKEYAKGDAQLEQDYLDSLANEKVYFGNWTLKDCREMEISLGLDLKGGMNVILEVSVPDVIKVLADNKPDEAFNQALDKPGGCDYPVRTGVSQAGSGCHAGQPVRHPTTER